MSECQVCGAGQFHEELVSEVFNIKGKFYLVESIPARVCNRCGEETFSRTITEQIRTMLHEQPRPVRSTTLDVFSFKEAV